MRVHSVIQIMVIVMVFVFLFRFYFLVLKYRPQFRIWFKNKYGYGYKSTLDLNYIKTMFKLWFKSRFEENEKFLQKARRDYIINLILFAFFVFLAGYLNN